LGNIWARTDPDRTEVVGVDYQQIQAEGTLGQTHDTGFRRRYGTTYVLLDEGEGGVPYALKSDTEDLGKYTEQYVRLSGFPVEGFPGEAEEPGYISVTRVN
jgi:hypothetical protein